MGGAREEYEGSSWWYLLLIYCVSLSAVPFAPDVPVREAVTSTCVCACQCGAYIVCVCMCMCVICKYVCVCKYVCAFERVN